MKSGLDSGFRLCGCDLFQACSGKRRQMGLLQQTITWYKIHHAGGQAHCYSRTGTLKQRPVKLARLRSLCFNVPVRNNNELGLQHGGFCTM